MTLPSAQDSLTVGSIFWECRVLKFFGTRHLVYNGIENRPTNGA